MKYFYQARSKEGNIETGTVEASSKEAAAVLLQKYSIYVTSIKEQTPSVFKGEISFLSKVSRKELAIFSRQLSVMLQARVPVVQSLKGLAAQTKNAGFKEKIIKIAQLVEEGNPLSEAFSHYPDVFNIFYTSLIKTGEASGKISESLYYLSEHLEREHDIISQIKSALIYPAFVIVVLVVVVFIVMFFVMPRLMDLLKETTTEPPFFTALMMGFYGFLMSFGWILVVAFIIGVAFLIFYLTTKEGRKKYDRWSLKVPFLGEFLKKIYLIQFAENISTLIGAGLTINRALEITRDTINNDVYKKILTETEESVSEGQRISSIMMKYPLFVPAFVVQMIQVGEETGTLDKNLDQIVSFYQKEVNRAVATFTALLEPMLIIFLGVVVAFLAVSVIEPLYGTLGTL